MSVGRGYDVCMNGVKDPGYYSVLWDRKDNLRRKVSSGVYFYQLKADGYTGTRKLVIVE